MTTRTALHTVLRSQLIYEGGGVEFVIFPSPRVDTGGQLGNDDSHLASLSGSPKA